MDDIIICDPEGEYFPLVSALHGQLIRIASNSEQHINPMDITIDDYMFSNPMEVIANKSDFLISLWAPLKTCKFVNHLGQCS